MLVFESSTVLDGEDGVSVQGYVGILIIRGGGREPVHGPSTMTPAGFEQTANQRAQSHREKFFL